MDREVLSTFEVRMLKSAERDLREIIHWVAQNDSTEKAHHLLDRLSLTYQNLKEMPNRGHRLPELNGVTSQSFLEVHQGPYRIIYHVQEKTVLVDAVLDGRRDMQELLEKRLLR